MYIPKVYDEYTSKRVLVCEWVEGTQLTNIDALTEAGIDYKVAMKTAIDAFSSQIFRSGFVHGKEKNKIILLRQTMISQLYCR